jgi:hypothetical protein
VTRVSLLPHRSTEHGVEVTRWTVWRRGVEVASHGRVASGEGELELRSEVTVDPAVVRRECGLEPSACLVLVVSWHARGTNLRRIVTRTVVDRASTHVIGFTLDETEALGEVVVERRVVLGGAAASDDPLTPTAAGAILWREAPHERATLRLGPPAPHLSIDSLDFRQAPELDERAAWALDVRVGDVHADGRAAVRLSVNTAHPAIAQLVDGDDRDERDQVASVLRWDVARRIVDAVLDDGRFVEEFGELAPETLAGSVQTMIQDRWPGVSARVLRDRRASSRAQFEAELQARFGLLRAR